MPESSLPPPPQKSGGSGALIAAALVMLTATGGLLYWRFSQTGGPDSEPPPPVEASTSPPPEARFEAPPPPPPPPEPDAGKPEAPKKTVKAVARGAGGCGGPCSGQTTAQLSSALRGQAGRARGCYERALRQNSLLQGRVVVGVRISPSGSVCSANLVENSLGDPSVTTCVLQNFRSARFPAPSGGCLDAQVPMRFEPKGQ